MVFFIYLVTYWILEALNVVRIWYFGSQIDIYNIRYTILILACGQSVHQGFLAKNTPKIDIFVIFHLFSHFLAFRGTYYGAHLVFGSQMIDNYNRRYTILILACGQSLHHDFLAKNTPKVDIFWYFSHI